ncbi:PAS domain S-box protein, partial [bacterium]|nr:PAS domain S-box protein [bacterium]
MHDPSLLPVDRVLLYESLIGGLPDAIAVLDLDGKILCWNSAAETIFATAPERALGRSVEEVTPPLESPVAKLTKPIQYPATISRADGKSVLLSVQLLPIRDEQGKVCGAFQVSRDVTAESSLDHQLIKQVQSMGQIGMWTYEIQSNQGWWSDQTYRLYGIPPGTPIAQDMALSRFPAKDREALTAALEKCVSEGTAFSLELRFRDASGQLRWVRSQCAPRLVEGTVTHLMGTFQDITEKYEAEQALHESEDLFHSLADNVPGLLWMSNPQGQGVYFNQRWMDFTGRSLTEGRSRDWKDIVHPEDWINAQGLYSQALAAQAPFERTYRLRHQDGKYRWVLERGVPRFHRDGSFAGYLANGTDITQERELRDRVELSERRLKHLMDTAPVGLFLADPEANVCYANQMFESVTGASEGSYIGQAWTHLIHPADQSSFLERWKGFISEEAPLDLEYRISKESGQELWVKMVAVKLHDGQYLGVLQDITELKTTERHLEEKRSYLSGIVNSNPDLI